VFLRDTLAHILADQRQLAVPPPEVVRDLAVRLPARSGQAVVLTGVRRAGKSVLLGQALRRARRPFYCNFEDTRLFALSQEDFPVLLDIVEQRVPQKGPVFLDEVQQAPEWQRLVRTLLDRGHSVCLTGSNASLLGRELGARLTGRHLSFEVLPFGYREYLLYTGQRAGAAAIRAYLDDGGFPTYLRERTPQLLQELLRDIVQRDIAVRHRLRETRHVMNLALFLLANIGQPFSLQRLTRSLAVPTVAQTSRYVEYLQDAYLMFAVPRFSASFKQRAVAPNKYYAVDNGLRRANSTQATPDVGHRLENAVFLALRARGGAVAYAAETGSWECDFVTEREAIQVCAELTPFNRGCEVEGAVRGAHLPGRRRRALIVTLDQRDRLVAEGTPIDVKPAWEWLA
jgi:uncharacterized protein